MSEQVVTVMLRDEIDEIEYLTPKLAVKYVRAALDAYQAIDRVSIYRVRSCSHKLLDVRNEK